jgi:hypothetical protein
MGGKIEDLEALLAMADEKAIGAGIERNIIKG